MPSDLCRFKAGILLLPTVPKPLPKWPLLSVRVIHSLSLSLPSFPLAFSFFSPPPFSIAPSPPTQCALLSQHSHTVEMLTSDLMDRFLFYQPAHQSTLSHPLSPPPPPFLSLFFPCSHLLIKCPLLFFGSLSFHSFLFVDISGIHMRHLATAILWRLKQYCKP